MRKASGRAYRLLEGGSETTIAVDERSVNAYLFERS